MPHTIVASCGLTAMVLFAATAFAQEDDDELSPGLRAEYTAGEQTIERIDGDLAFDWTTGAPDLQLPAGPFRAAWKGQLLLRSEGTYRFHAYLQGKLTVRVNDAIVLDGESETARWISGENVELSFGEFPVQMDYASLGAGRVMLCWSSDQFPLEPLPQHALFHERADIAHTPFPHGAAEYVQQGCARCHGEINGTTSAGGPSLDHFGVETSPAWLKTQIQQGGGEHGRMPRFGLTEDDALALAAHLAKLSEPVNWTIPENPPAAAPQDIAAGQELIVSVGCLACHSWQDRAKDGWSVGPSLNLAGRHRTARWLHQWLANPDKLNASHQMPVFTLSDEERRQIVAALVDAAQERAYRSEGNSEFPEKLAERGRELFQELRCGVCHATPGPMPRLKSTNPWRELDLNGDACWGEKPDRDRSRPAFGLKQTEHVRDFMQSAKRGAKAVASDLQGAQLLIQKGCVNCHDRDGRKGISSFAAHVAASLPNLQGRAPWLIPPSLTAVGDRLPDARLAMAIRGELPTRRLDWLKIRMPKYRHTEGEQAALLAHLIGHDRIPDDPPAMPVYPLNGKHMLEGRELIGGKGFSCVACHPVKDFTPKQVALGTRGSNLFQIGDRLRPEYFFRWTRSPLRVMPGVEMPSYQRPHATIFPNDLNQQLASIWTALNDPDLPTPVNPGAVEQYWTVDPDDPPRILRDVVTLPGKKEITIPRAFAVGFPNGHNILFDLDTASVRAWTVGDFAQQRTQGKSWFWDLVGTPVMVNESGESDVLIFSADGKTKLFPSESAKIRLTYSGASSPEARVLFSYTIQMNHAGMEYKARIQEAWTAMPLGWIRSTTMDQLHDFSTMEVYLLEPSSVKGPTSVQFESVFNNKPTALPGTTRRGFRMNSDEAICLEHKDPREKILTEVPVQHVASSLPEEVNIVPGFGGRRLPYPRTIMPTAMTFDHRGRMFFTSLKGHVYSADDHEAKLFAEGLAAPFGILNSLNLVLVAHKPEIIGMVDSNNDGRADEMEVFATGWGLTDDYHDWTCGLVRDAEGNLFTVLGSDYAQKDRPLDKSLWRGHALKIDPAGKIESVARGLRFPTGVAMTSEQHVFITDQQGVQNTFNELNWLEPRWGRSPDRAPPTDRRSPEQRGQETQDKESAGSGDPRRTQADQSLSRAADVLRFGVPSLHEPDKDAPATPPAVQIPHPWTRSVNGICAIPKSLADRTHPKLFDQLLGCEYDNRFLVRFSHQMVDGVMQGAAYPFSKPGSSSSRALSDAPGSPANQSLSRASDSSGFLGPLSIAVGPEGDVYVGSIHDSGWQGGLNTGDIVKLSPHGDWPNGLCEIRATPVGFDLEFFHPVDSSRAEDKSRYQISGYTRVWEGSYATPDSGRHPVEIAAAKLSEAGTVVSLTLTGLKPGHVYDVSVGEIGLGKERTLWPHIGHYTLHKIPKSN